MQIVSDQDVCLHIQDMMDGEANASCIKYLDFNCPQKLHTVFCYKFARFFIARQRPDIAEDYLRRINGLRDRSIAFMEGALRVSFDQDETLHHQVSLFRTKNIPHLFPVKKQEKESEEEARNEQNILKESEELWQQARDKFNLKDSHPRQCYVPFL